MFSRADRRGAPSMRSANPNGYRMPYRRARVQELGKLRT
jgi:hypothetical protein